ELVAAVNKRSDVLYIQVYDEKGQIIHDGTSDLQLYGTLLNDELTVKSLREGKTFTQVAGDELRITAPITILDNRIGGVRVGYSLKRALGYIAYQQADQERNYEAVASHELHTIVIIALIFSFGGLILVVFMGGTWRKPLLLFLT